MDCLFNEDTGKGKGCDRLGIKKDGLKLCWRWSQVCEMSWTIDDKRRKDKRRLPCQTCSSEVGDFRFKVILWHSHYESRVEYKHKIISYDETSVTRLSAQFKAEKLLIEFHRMLSVYVAENLF